MSKSSLSFWQTMKSYTRPFWCANFIELFERWAYYGVRGGIAVYLVAAVAKGGLGFNHLQKGNIFLWWAAFQSILPTFIGGFADRYGYKKSVFIAVTLTILGYLNMAVQTSYWPFFIACMMVALGTALFKPGLQGTLAHSTTSQNAALGWSIFYMVVNIGGFTGPLIAGYLRLMSWKYVFITSALMHSVNYLILLTYKSPENKVKVKTQGIGQGLLEFFKVFWSSIANLLAHPPLIMFLLVFSGFWLMFMQLFDLLPNYITDWVDTASVSIFFGKLLGIKSWVAYGMSGQQLPAEWFINLDAGAIIIFMLPIGWMFGRMFAVSAMVLGIVVATAGLLLSGYTMNPWWCLLGIFVFAVGEMIASPRKSEYLAMIAPPEKKGLYMGYVNFPQGIGWMAGSALAAPIYQFRGDKLTLARRYLTDNLGLSAEQLKSIAPEKVVDVLAQQLQLPNARAATKFLFDHYQPNQIWWYFVVIGLISMVGMLIYNIYFARPKKNV
jgi:proton-dependent oligopeptide transporter, POT family